MSRTPHRYTEPAHSTSTHASRLSRFAVQARASVSWQRMPGPHGGGRLGHPHPPAPQTPGTALSPSQRGSCPCCPTHAGRTWLPPWTPPATPSSTAVPPPAPPRVDDGSARGKERVAARDPKCGTQGVGFPSVSRAAFMKACVAEEAWPEARSSNIWRRHLERQTM